MTTGQRIRQCRLELGLTQRKLGERLDCDLTTISRWERDLSPPQSVHCVKLAEVFGVTTDWILGVAPSEPAPATGTEG